MTIFPLLFNGEKWQIDIFENYKSLTDLGFGEKNQDSTKAEKSESLLWIHSRWRHYQRNVNIKNLKGKRNLWNWNLLNLIFDQKAGFLLLVFIDII